MNEFLLVVALTISTGEVRLFVDSSYERYQDCIEYAESTEVEDQVVTLFYEYDTVESAEFSCVRRDSGLKYDR